ncbi:EamA family transporter RarD [Pseudomonas syringae pv. syringae]|uniref:EamA family transporter RarD n=1 Tax=Pseudomonas syringae TaxID=317 RepID=UPI0023F70457|nr:EamA family transporter RarD [Pseudomonas syringae]MDF5892767.1 EamA family transporter RarD [Pseudomonas syringae pv. syringae]
MYKGIALSVGSSCLFGFLYYYATLLRPLNGEQIFGWRMLLMLPCITVFLLVSGEWRHVVSISQHLRHNPLQLALLCLSSLLLGSQQWLFMWAPLNGRGLEVSLGYFLLPLVMLMVGKVFYGERLSAMQKAAAVFAVLGVLNELYQVGQFSWATMLVAIGFPLYFMLRRKLATANLGGLWFDILLTFPVAVWFVVGQRCEENAPGFTWQLGVLLAGLAIISAAAFMAYTLAGKLLPFGLFGLLGYVEPVLLIAVAFALGEHIKPGQWLTYVPIWIAVGLLLLEGSRYLAKTSCHSREKSQPL